MKNKTRFEIGKIYKSSEQGNVIEGVLYYQVKIVRGGMIYHLYSPIDNSTLKYLFRYLKNQGSERIFRLHKIIDKSELEK